MRRATENAHFVDKVFSDEEIEYARGAGDPAPHFAGAYAAKEALAKATGLGMFAMGLRESWVRRTESGPVVECSARLRERLEERGIRRVWLTISHEGEYALAFVVLES